MRDALVIAEASPASSEDVLSPPALVFLAELVRAFRGRIGATHSFDHDGEPTLVAARAPEPPPSWTCAPAPAPLGGPRVDLVGAADTASITRALSSHASAYVADLDDSTLPSWRDLLDGQALLRNLHLRSRRSRHPAHAAMPPVFLRPRSLLALEEHLFIDAQPVPAGLVDVGLYCFHNAATLSERGEGPWFSLTKLRDANDVRVWSDIAIWIEHRLSLGRDAIKLSVRIDTMNALAELDDILWTLRSHVLSVACGRFDLLCDLIATSARSASRNITPARGFFTVDRAPLAAVAARIVETCRRRGVQAMGPVLPTAGASRLTFARTYANAGRQARLGFDGTRVVDADLVPVARAALAARGHACVASQQRLQAPLPVATPLPTETAVRENIEVALVHLDAVLGGQSRIRLDARLEDCASARAARAQLWQWLRARVTLSRTERLDRGRFRRLVLEESLRLTSPLRVRALLEYICTSESLDTLLEREDRLHRGLTVDQAWRAE